MREVVIIKNLWRLLRPSRFWMLAAVLVGALSSLSEGFGITLFIPVLNAVGPSSVTGGFPHALQRLLPSQGKSLMFYISLIFGLLVLKNILVYSNRALLSRVEGQTGHVLRCRIFSELMNARCAFWNGRDPGKVLDTLANESWRASQSIQLLSGTFLYACTVLVFTTLLFLVSWRLTSLVVMGLLAISALLRWASLPLRKMSEEAVEVNAALGARMWDGVAGIRAVQAFALQRLKVRGFAETSDLVRRSFLKVELLSGFVPPASEICFAALLLGVLAWRIPGGGSVPATLVFLLLLFRLQPNVSLLQSCLLALSGVAGSVEDVAELLDSAGTAKLESGTLPFEGLTECISFDAVSFRYDGETRPALDNVNVRIPAGKLTVIAGPSGAGKSTFAHLLCRFFDVTEGSIRIDGQRLTDFDLESWRNRIAVASQDTHLFSTTVRENIALGRAGATEDDVIEAAVGAGAHEFIQELPDRYDTAVGERGMRLSGGERQRIALARALIRKPEILILDEATNALEGPLEKAVLEALADLKSSATVIVITHRPDTIAFFTDHAIVLEAGKVIEQDRPEYLIQRRGRFYDLCGELELANAGSPTVCDTL
jgi:ATP-binding cassette, subfamily B, bacterial MsbA